MANRFVVRNRTIFFGDLLLIAAAAPISYALRLNFGARLGDFFWQILTMILLGLILKPLVYYRLGLYRRIWAYASIQEAQLIVLAVSFASILLYALVAIIQALGVFEEFSRGALVIDWLLTLLFTGGWRFSFRILAEQNIRRSAHGRQKRVIVVGAGDAGALVVREMRKNPQGGLLPVCFVDDDPAKYRQEIHGVRVAGTVKDLPRLVDVQHADEVVIAIPSAPGKVIRVVSDLCRLKGIPSRTMPGLQELIGGKVSVNRLREVDITDLLRREPARIDDQLVGQNLQGKRVLITGAGGSIGSELCRQVMRWNPSALILLGHGENSIYEIWMQLQEDYPTSQLIPVIADARDRQRLQNVFSQQRPQVVFHAAAHKHVMLMETNIEEAITNNILGTRNLVEAALEANVERLVMISTDKAVRPSSVMGATKRLAEMLVLDAARRSGRAFSVVRFGNVLGSRGSVVQRFKRQIAAGGPITITHPDMYRYFMTIPEAVHLVLQAFAMGQNGEIFVLNMGEQVRILDLAEDLIRLSGLEPHKDIEFAYTEPRPGEKLREILWDESDSYTQTTHPDVLQRSESSAAAPNLTGAALYQVVDDLTACAQAGNAQAIVEKLNQLIPGASLQGDQRE